MSTSTRVTRGLLLLFVGAACLAGARVWVATPAAAAVSAVLESSALRVEVTTAPYWYAVIEKSTGEVLLRQAQTTFTAGTARAVSTAAIGKKTAATLDATLTFPESADTAHVRWTFVNPAVVQVALTYGNGAPTNITEAFLDQGERNYGLWEYSYYGTGGALDNRGASNQPLLGLSGPPVGSGDPSARAPFYVTSRKYGVYADTLALGRATVAVKERTSLSFDAPALTYNVIYGPSPAQVLARYNQLAGGSLMPPLWAFDVDLVARRPSRRLRRQRRHQRAGPREEGRGQPAASADSGVGHLARPPLGLRRRRPRRLGQLRLRHRAHGVSERGRDDRRPGRPQHVPARVDRQPRQQHDAHRSGVCPGHLQRRERLRGELHDDAGVGSAPAGRVRALQEPVAGQLREARHARLQDRPRRAGRGAGRAAERTGDPDREGGARRHGRRPGTGRVHVRPERLRPRAQVRRRLDRGFQLQFRRHVGLAEAAPAARRDHVFDGQFRYRRLRPRPDRGALCPVAGAQRVLADDAGPAGPESHDLEQLQHGPPGGRPNRPGPECQSAAPRDRPRVRAGAPRPHSVHAIDGLRLDRDRACRRCG